MQQKGQCKDCRHVHVGVGFIHPPLTCTNWPGADGRWLIVEPDSSCENFKPKYGEEENYFKRYGEVQINVGDSG